MRRHTRDYPGIYWPAMLRCLLLDAETNKRTELVLPIEGARALSAILMEYAPERRTPDVPRSTRRETT